jgi:hypothetical protein
MILQSNKTNLATRSFFHLVVGNRLSDRLSFTASQAGATAPRDTALLFCSLLVASARSVIGSRRRFFNFASQKQTTLVSVKNFLDGGKCRAIGALKSSWGHIARLRQRTVSPFLLSLHEIP